MTTVAELKNEAVKLGLTGISKLKKADLETLITEARQAEEVRKGKRIASMMKAEKTLADIQTARQAESVTGATAEAVPSDPRATRRALADAAGKRATVTSPMDSLSRERNYASQLGWDRANPFIFPPLTPAQSRRINKCKRRALKTALAMKVRLRSS